MSNSKKFTNLMMINGLSYFLYNLINYIHFFLNDTVLLSPLNIIQLIIFMKKKKIILKMILVINSLLLGDYNTIFRYLSPIILIIEGRTNALKI